MKDIARLNNERTKICVQCKKPFRLNIIRNGIPIRLYDGCDSCPTCKPNPDKNEMHFSNVGMWFQCMDCKKPYQYVAAGGNSNSVKRCGRCNRKFGRHNRKIAIITQYGGKCQLCGYDRHIDILVFHHKNPKHKDFAIGNKLGRCDSYLAKELKKCILLCPNCHAEVHAGHRKLSEIIPGTPTACIINGGSHDQESSQEVSKSA